MPIRSVRIAVAAGVAIAAASTVLLSAGAASADPAPTKYPVTFAVTKASTSLANPNSKATVNFKDTTLYGNLYGLDGTGPGVFALSGGNLPLAPVPASFKAYGFLPARGTVVFTQVKPITAEVDLDQTTHLFSVTAKASYVVTLRNVVIGGAQANVGTNCQTVRPVTVTVSSDSTYTLSDGGPFTGNYTLSQFQNCGAASHIINDTLPGKDNSLALNIGGVIFGDGSGI